MQFKLIGEASCQDDQTLRKRLRKQGEEWDYESEMHPVAPFYAIDIPTAFS